MPPFTCTFVSCDMIGTILRFSQEHTHTHTFNGPFSRTIWVSQYQKSKTSLDFTEARDSEWQWHQLGHMQVCISFQIIMPVPHHSVFLQAGCPSCRPTNSVKALKAKDLAKNRDKMCCVPITAVHKNICENTGSSYVCCIPTPPLHSPSFSFPFSPPSP